MSDGMPAAKSHYAKVKKAKVVKKHHRHGPECPPDHDDSWAIAEQLNHEEWLRHRQDDLSHRGGGYEDDQFSGYDDRYGPDYADAGEDDRGWDRGEDDAALLAEAGAEGFRRDEAYEGRARRYVDKRVYRRYSSSGRSHGWDGEHRGWSSGGHGWGHGERRLHRSQGGHGGGYAWRDFDRFGGGHVEKRVYKSYGGSYGYDGDAYAGGYDDDRRYGEEVYAGGSRHFDERAGRHDGARHERRVIIEKRYGDGHRASRYGHADDRLFDHRDYGYGYAGGYGEGGGYASSSYSSYGYGDGYGYEGGYGRGGYRFHYDAGYAGRDELGYLTWPGKAG